MAGRKKNPHPTKPVTFSATPKLLRYLEDLVLEEGYGNTPAEVARSLTWRGIEELVSRGVLSRRPGQYPKKRRRASSPGDE